MTTPLCGRCPSTVVRLPSGKTTSRSVPAVSVEMGSSSAQQLIAVQASLAPASVARQPPIRRSSRMASAQRAGRCWDSACPRTMVKAGPSFITSCTRPWASSPSSQAGNRTTGLRATAPPAAPDRGSCSLLNTRNLVRPHPGRFPPCPQQVRPTAPRRRQPPRGMDRAARQRNR